jgi:hypothetical protein
MRPSRGHDAGFMIIRPADCFLWRSWILQTIGRSFPIGVSDRLLYSRPRLMPGPSCQLRHPKDVSLKFGRLILLQDYFNPFFTTNSPEFRCCDTFRSPIQSITKLELTVASVIDHTERWTHTLWLNRPNKRRYMPRMEKLVCTV